MFEKRHYEAIARVLKLVKGMPHSDLPTLDRMEDNLIRLFYSDNRNFRIDDFRFAARHNNEPQTKQADPTRIPLSREWSLPSRTYRIVPTPPPILENAPTLGELLADPDPNL